MRVLEDTICSLEEQQNKTKETIERMIEYCDIEIEKLELAKYDKSIKAYQTIKKELIQKRKKANTILRSEELLRRVSILSLQQQINEIIYIFQVYGHLSDLRHKLVELDYQELMSALNCYGIECDFLFQKSGNTLDDLRQTLYQKAGIECVPASVIEQMQYGYYMGYITEQEYKTICKKAGIKKAGIAEPITINRTIIDYDNVIKLEEGSYPRPLYQKKKTL